MPMYSAGTTVKWRSTALGQVTGLRFVKGGGGLPIGRRKAFAVDAGTVEISSVCATTSETMISFAKVDQYGVKGTIEIQGTGGTTGQGSLTVTTKAICQSLDISATVNDVWRLKGVFKIVME